MGPIPLGVQIPLGSDPYGNAPRGFPMGPSPIFEEIFTSKNRQSFGKNIFPELGFSELIFSELSFSELSFFGVEFFSE